MRGRDQRAAGRTPYHWLARNAAERGGEPAVLTWQTSTVCAQLDWATLRSRVERARAGLIRKGIKPEERVILALPNDAEFVIVILACMGAGALAAPAPVPTVSRTQAFRDRLSGMLTAVAPALLVTTDAWAPLIGKLVDSLPAPCRLATAGELEAAGQDSLPDHPVPGGDIAFLQFTSGSTGTPRGVVVEYEALRAACRQARAAYREVRTDVAVTWVPLYHDMGLVTAVMRPLYSGYPSVLLRPEEFVRSPANWLNAIDRCGGTLASAPNFGYELCTRKVPDEQAAALDLSRWRVARNAGEVIRADTLDRFAARFASAGFRPEAMCPSYGLAEATLTVTTCGPLAKPLRVSVRRCDLEEARAMPGGQAADCDKPGWDRLVSSGVPLPATEVRISGQQETDGHVGEVLVRGPQLSPGYWVPGGPQPRPSPVPGWYATGDLGFLWNGHLFVLGRSDDRLILNGRSYYAADVAAACAHVRGTRPGRAAAFLADGNQATEPRVWLVAELSDGQSESAGSLRELAMALQRTLARRLELSLSEVGFVRRGELPVTTSGKVRISEVRRRSTAGTMPFLARETTGKPVRVPL